MRERSHIVEPVPVEADVLAALKRRLREIRERHECGLVKSCSYCGASPWPCPDRVAVDELLILLDSA